MLHRHALRRNAQGWRWSIVATLHTHRHPSRTMLAVQPLQRIIALLDLQSVPQRRERAMLLESAPLVGRQKRCRRAIRPHQLECQPRLHRLRRALRLVHHQRQCLQACQQQHRPRCQVRRQHRLQQVNQLLHHRRRRQTCLLQRQRPYRPRCLLLLLLRCQARHPLRRAHR